ncbi:MAG: hypothetical protein WA982_08145 [Rubrobacteraceae bacterium]
MVDGDKQSLTLSAEEYISGLTAIASCMSDVQRRILFAQYHAPYRTVTSPQLAKLAEIQGGYPVVNSHYGRLGREFCENTGFRPNGGWWRVWSLGYSTPEGYMWEMRPQVAEAIESLGWVSPRELPIPEEISSKDWLVEGSTKRITVNAYERNQEARRKCIEHYGSSCVVCGLDLALLYGPIAQGFVHVHHLKPLSDMGMEYVVDPVADLRPVCPNCHAIIHLGGKTRTIEEVRELLEHENAGVEADLN